MTMRLVLLGMSMLASLLVVQLGPRPQPNADRNLKRILAEFARRPPAHFLWTRVTLLVLSATLLVMAIWQTSAAPRA